MVSAVQLISRLLHAGTGKGRGKGHPDGGGRDILIPDGDVSEREANGGEESHCQEQGFSIM